LLQATNDGQVRRLKLLIEAHANVDYQDSNGETALHKVARNDYMDCASLLLHSGADINVVDNMDRTAIIIAAISGNAIIVEFLIQNRASMDAMNKLS